MIRVIPGYNVSSSDLTGDLVGNNTISITVVQLKRKGLFFSK